MRAGELLSWLGVYLEFNLLLALGLAAAGTVLALAGSRLSRTQALRVARVAFVLALVCPVAAQLLPRDTFTRSGARVESAGTRPALTSGSSHRPSTVRLAPEASTPSMSWLLIKAGALHALAGLLLAGILYFLGRLGIRIHRLRRLLGTFPLVRRAGRVRVLVAPGGVPYSTRLFGRAFVVLPESTLDGTDYFRIAAAHELQHHRQRDTSWLYAVEVARALFFWNPAAAAWARTLEKLQEFACDEILIGRRNISPRAYGGCLLKAAETAVGSRLVPAGTTGMATGSSGTLLKRRIEMILTQRKEKSARSWLPLALALVLAAVTGTAAFASRSALLARTIGQEEAEEYARIAGKGSQIPITVNRGVLQELNRMVGTPEGREHLREARLRMPIYQSMIERKLGEYGFPGELMAMPFHESGFDNERRFTSAHAAGIWQFIPSTARRYDLVVNEERDDRFNEAKETDAAMHYLKDLHELFHDWRLAVMAYNVGESKIQRQIDKLGTRDPWVLEEADRQEGYLSKVTATMIVLKNPSLLD